MDTLTRPAPRRAVFLPPVAGWLGVVLLVILTPLRAQTDGQDVAAYKKLSLAQLMDVEVTSVSRREQKLLDVPSAIQVVTSDDLRRAGAYRLPMALRLFSNLAVAQVDSRQWAITARGFNNTLANKMLVQMDGRIIYTPLYAGVFWDAQDTFMPDLDRIEVISGPGATQWGSNAVNGVINITTKNSRDTQGGMLVTGGGTELDDWVSARYGGAISPDLHYRVYAKHISFDQSKQNNGAGAGDDWSQSQAGFRLDWDTPARDLVTLQGDIYSGRVSVLTTPDVKMSGGNLLGRWSRTMGPDAGIKVQAYFDQTYRKIPGTIEENLKIVDVDLQHHSMPTPGHNVVWGLNFRSIDDDLTNSALLAFYPTDVTRHWYSGFLQDEIVLPDPNWRLTLGSKFEHNPYTGTEVQPSVRLAWKVNPSTLLWGAISHAVRTPSRIDREIYSPATAPYTIAGGSNFDSEKLMAYELGLRAQPDPKLAYTISTFYHDYDDLRSLEPVGGGTSVIANGIVGHSYGAELNADYSVTRSWRLQLGYTELRVQSRPKPGSLDQTSVRSQSLDPNHQARLVSHFDFSERLSFSSTLRYVAPLINQSVPGYTELDAQLRWAPNQAFELSLSGQNLLHPEHREFGTLATGRQIERNGSAVLTWHF